MNYDYDDMVKSGAIKTDTVSNKSGNRKYAIILKTAYASVGKFDITDADSVKESIYALQHNDIIPEPIRKSAEYFVKQAADFYNVKYNINPAPAPHEIVVSDIITKLADQEHVIMLSFGNKKFVLDTEEHIKTAEEYFIRKKHLFPPQQRINVSRIIEKRATESGYTADPIISAYAKAEYGNQVETVLHKKASLSGNSKYAAVMESLCKCYNSIPVDEFLEMVESCDKAAEVRHNVYGIETHDLLLNADTDEHNNHHDDSDNKVDLLLSISSPSKQEDK